jgi:hypothetical protein
LTIHPIVTVTDRIIQQQPYFLIKTQVFKGIRAQQEEIMVTKGAIVGTQARVGNTNTV